jgi:hypothetical protein
VEANRAAAVASTSTEKTSAMWFPCRQKIPAPFAPESEVVRMPFTLPPLAVTMVAMVVAMMAAPVLLSLLR